MGDKSVKSSYRSKASHKSTNSRAQQVIDRIQAGAGENGESPAYSNKLVEELIGTLQVCNNCSNSLTEDERVINARFI